jgi:phosphoribosyl-AMP cyclohydrolase
MVAIDVMLDGTVTMNGQQGTADVSFDTLFNKLKDHHIFLTFVDGQGKKLPYSIYKEWLSRYDFTKVTLAGGISSVEDVVALHKQGIDVHVGASIYRGDITLSTYLNAILDKNINLFPMCVQGLEGNVLGILYTNRDTLKIMCDTMKLTAYSRTRKSVWVKDEKKGGVDVVSIRHNCNCDSLLVVVKDGKQDWCHDGRRSCFSI